MIRSACIVCLFLSACGGRDRAEFGPPRAVPAENRNFDWDASVRDRLGIDMSRFGGASSTPSAGAGVEATTPAGWERLEPKGQFRDAVWRVAGNDATDCYLTIGVGGGVAFNLQRWYQNQFAQPVPEASGLPEISFAGRTGRLCEIEGTFGGKPDYAALIAYVADGQRITSLKFTGPKQAVQENRDAFLSLAASITIAAGGGGSPAPTGSAPPIQPGQAPPADHPPMSSGQGAGGGQGAGAAAGGGGSEAPFTADTPEGWNAVAGSGRVLHHRFGRSGEVYLSQLGGSLQQSLGIFRGQFEQNGQPLGPLTDEEFAALPGFLFLGDDAVLLEATGTYRPMSGGAVPDSTLLLAARQDGNSIVFCKLVGSAAEVQEHRDAFVQFCGSIRRKS